MTDTLDIQPGSIVRCRHRQWVVLPSENLNLVRLRSLSGLTQKLSESLICVTAKKPRTPSFRRACVSPIYLEMKTTLLVSTDTC